MNNKGFTLVELLAVIVLIGIIGIITVPVVDRIIKDSRKKTELTNIDIILNGAYDFAQQNPDRLPKSINGQSGVDITFTDMVTAGILKEDMIDPTTKSKYKGTSKVVIKYYSTPSSGSNLKNDNNKFFGNYLFTFVK
jgi:prepilin-type N-terminal cleavage/methylation domain